MRSSRLSLHDLIFHLHPPSVRSQTLRFTLSWGLGGMAVVLIGLLILSGMLLLLSYQPTTEYAYASILLAIQHIPFGRWVRNIHYLSANILVFVAVLHFVRVVFTGAFGLGRRLNWILGLILLALVLAANFTGYLLPWDQLSYWAVTICTSMLGYIPLCGDWLRELFRGGIDIGPATLSNFFVLHVTVIPGLLLIVMFWHFWLIRRAGGLVHSSTQEPSPRIFTMPHLIMREAAVGLTLVACILVLAIFWNAPLQEQANPGMSPNPAKAPWYFQGLQELLLHLHPMFTIFIWPAFASLALFLIPFWHESVLPSGQWFGSPRGRKLALCISVFGIVITIGAILFDDMLLVSHSTTANTWVTRGLLPSALLFGLLILGYWLLVRTYRYTRAEVVMAGFLLAFAAISVCTIIGVWFRGPEMRLVWPWQGGI
ncbi:cytochrome b N-terminal domain-containing protein [Desulfovibrio inopinatus]|uniref:cytochrome b N-terminal domain-containing protein n=1 Tax=Desulfovibrio inopinatus TaxID=102109 RepID=UPI0004839B10|nr:cytochrome b N-terminal domain-containing protein [Desulfovibrio inopinatus]